MGLLNIKKNNDQNVYYNQNPNMAAPNNMYNQPMMNPNQGMMPNQQMYNQPQMARPPMQPLPQQPMQQAPQQPVMNPNMPNGGMQQPMNRPMPQQPAPQPMPPQPQSNVESLEEETALPRQSENTNVEAKAEEAKPNPLDNDKNEIPVNPIISQLESYNNVDDIGQQKDVKANLFAALGIIFGMIVKPGTTMLNNAKKYKQLNKAFSIMIWLSVIFLVVCLASRALIGSFDRTYSSLTDTYKLTFNPARIFQASNYLEPLLIAALVSVGGVLVVSGIYYASSFINSKGVHFSTYLVVSNLGLIPLIFGVIVLFPVGTLLNVYIGIGVLIFSFLASVITLLIGMNEVLTFKGIDSQIFYHVINLSIVTLIVIFVFVFMVHNGWIVLDRAIF